MRINTNVASMTAQENAANVNKNLSASLEKLSSGLRINKAADDSSGMAIADKLRTQASALGQSISNANSAGALVQIADKAMAEQSNILDIVKTKLIQAATETTSAEGRDSIRKDVSKLLEQLDNIAGQTNYNGINLLDTKGKEFTFQVGEDSTYDIGMTTAYAANTTGLGIVADATGATKTFALNDNAANGQTLTMGSYSVTLDATTGADNTAALTALANVINGTDASATPPTTNANVDTNGYTASVVDGNLVLTSSVLGADADQTDFNTAVASLDLVSTDVTRTTITDVTAADSVVNGVAASSTKASATMPALSALKEGDSVTFAFGGSTGGSLTVTATGNMTAEEVAQDFKTQFEDLATTPEATTGNDWVFSTDGAGAITLTATTAVDQTVTDSQYTLTYTEGTSSSATETDDVGSGNSLISVKNVAEGGLSTALANEYMSVIDQALTEINVIRSDFGSTQNQLDSFVRNAMTTQTNIKAAESVIRDVDYAAESANFNKQNIIAQAGTYAMSQANAVQQNVMRLLQ